VIILQLLGLLGRVWTLRQTLLIIGGKYIREQSLPNLSPRDERLLACSGGERIALNEEEVGIEKLKLPARGGVKIPLQMKTAGMTRH